MRVPLSWLRELVHLPPEVDGPAVAAALTRAGLEVEAVHVVGADVSGVVVARVLSFEEEEHSNGKTVRWCQVDDGTTERGVVCGARNFAQDDLVVLAQPGACLPGGFHITARKTYGHVSDGMICSAKELGLSEDHSGILVLPAEEGLVPGIDAVGLLDLRDEVVELAVTPDRGYALSMRGVAREVATAFELPFRDPAEVSAPAPDSDGHPVQVLDSRGCDRYVARAVSGVDPTRRSPLARQTRLLRAGMRPISAVVDVTNLVMLELGQPLHAFDRARLSGEVVVRRAEPGERLVTLDGVDRELHPEDVVIADDSGPVALAGVMGGAATEVGDETTEVLLESAHFDPVCVARTMRRHRLPSEASRRYERGVDPDLAPHAAERAVQLLAEVAGAASSAPATDVDARPARATVTLPVGLPARVAGVPYDAETVERRLAEVGCVTQRRGDDLVVLPPSWRPDLVDPYDLVEEVVRLEGYEQLPSVVPAAPAGRGLTPTQRLRRRAADALADAGFVEAPSYPFIGPAVLDALGLPEDDERRRLVALANPLSEEESALRTSLLPGLLRAVTRNRARAATPTGDLALFEAGPVFLLPEGGLPDAPRPSVGQRPSAAEREALDAALPRQPRHVGVVLAGRVEPAGWWGPGREASWADAVEAVRTVARAVRAEVTVQAADVAPWHPGRCAAVLLDGRVVGHAGELHPRVVAALELPPRTCAAEVDLDALVASAPGPAPAPVASAFPPAALDVALVVDEGVPAATVEAALRRGAGPLLEDVRLFDVYAGEQLGEGVKSLAYALRFRAADRTLTVEEATAARDAAVAEATEATGARLRA